MVLFSNSLDSLIRKLQPPMETLGITTKGVEHTTVPTLQIITVEKGYTTTPGDTTRIMEIIEILIETTIMTARKPKRDEL